MGIKMHIKTILDDINCKTHDFNINNISGLFFKEDEERT